MSINEKLLGLKADFITGFKASHDGKADGWERAWRDLEPDMLCIAKTQYDKEITEAQASQEQAARMSQKRSEMSSADKASFVGEHGLEAFQKLPA